jgi:hypothetical protein
MIEQFKRISIIAAMAAILALGTTGSARADLEIQLSLDGVSYTTVASDTSGGVATFTSAATGWSTSGIRVSALATDSNSPGTPGLAILDGSALSLTNVTTATKTLYIKLGDTGFTQPTAPPGFLVLDSLISGNVVVARAANSLVFQSYVDPANGQNSTPAIYTTGPQTPSLATFGGFSSDAMLNIAALTGPFSMTEFFKVTLGAGGRMSFGSSTTLTAVPEPSSLAIAAFSTISLVGFGLRRRFRGA